MRFTCDTNELNTALSIVSRALAVRSTKPILEGILFESCDEGLRLTCTDLALGIETLLPATFSEEGRAVLPGKLLCEIIRKLPGGPCDITVGERMQATIRCASVRTTINGFDPVEYPELPQVEGERFELPQNTLKDMVGRTLFAIAQDESRSISQNIRWGYEKRFAQGIHHMGNRRVLGYDEVNGVLTPNEDAWIVRMAFELFNQGMGYQKIAEAITAAGGKRMRGSTAFSASSIQSIVDNEIYVGDRMLQKRPPQHYLTKKPDPNAQYQTYYWRDTHEGIIDRKTWEKAQAVLDARKRDRISGVYKKTPATHFLYGKVFCARCGAPYKRRTLSGGTTDGAPFYHKVWNCRERQKGKAGSGCRNASVAEEELLRGISDALGWEWKGAEEFDTERFLREVQAVHLENGAASVQKWTQRVSA